MTKRYSQILLTMVSVACAAVAVAVEPAPSAVLEQVKGRVFVGQGKAMGLAQERSAVYAGNRVVTVTGAGARLVYPDGCAIALGENTLVAIGGADQCRTGQAVVRATDGFQHRAIGAVLDPQVSNLLGRFDTLNPTQLVNSYNALSPALQTQLVGALSDAQLTSLYVAIGSVSGQGAAASFLGMLPVAQAQAVVAGVGVAGAAGITIGAVTLTGMQVTALGLGMVGAVAGVGASEVNSHEGRFSENPPASQ